MNKYFNLFAIAIVAICLGLSSCGKKSNADLMKDYEKKALEAVEAMQNNDFDKAQKLNEELMDIMEKMKENGMSADDEAQFQKIQVSLLEKASGSASSILENAMNQAQETLDEGLELSEGANLPGSINAATEELSNAVKDATDELDRATRQSGAEINKAMRQAEKEYNKAMKEVEKEYNDAINEALDEIDF